MQIPVETTFTWKGKDYSLQEFKRVIRDLDAENARLREALEKYKNCRHACVTCFCTQEAREALKQ